MSEATLTQFALAPRRGPNLDGKPHASVGIGFAVVLAGALAYMAYSVLSDVHNAGGPVLATGVYMLLGLALLIALGFEFVNGFHDTANAVATVIYTHSLPAQVAVIWSGFFNFLGVLTSSGTVAFTVAACCRLASEAVRLMQKGGMKFGDAEDKALKGWKGDLDSGTKFIPLWVKVSVAVAPGLGTMIGWKRIVVTVGEQIGKTHLSYGQGAAAEIVAAITIGTADAYGLPVSTTHVLSSGVAGTMAANGSGLQWGTVRNIAMAWVLTLPAAAVLAGVLYFLLRMVF